MKKSERAGLHLLAEVSERISQWEAELDSFEFEINRRIGCLDDMRRMQAKLEAHLSGDSDAEKD
jgi:uncharacterized small protein (DUF1192 family)